MKFALLLISLLASYNAIAAVDISSISITSSAISITYTPNNVGDAVVYNYTPATERIGGDFYRVPANINFEFMTTGVGIDLYSVTEGQEFSSATIESGAFNQLVASSPTEGFLGFGTSYYLPSLETSYTRGQSFFNAHKGSGTFYLGIHTGGNFQPWFFDRSVFGWAEVAYSPNGLQLIRSAVTYDQNGIIVGSLNTIPIPEPETYLMLTVGLGQLAFLSRRRRNAGLS